MDQGEARRQFEQEHGETKAQAVRMILEGLDNEEIQEATGCSRQKVAAYRAHIRMGTYMPLLAWCRWGRLPEKFSSWNIPPDPPEATPPAPASLGQRIKSRFRDVGRHLSGESRD